MPKRKEMPFLPRSHNFSDFKNTRGDKEESLEDFSDVQEAMSVEEDYSKLWTSDTVINMLMTLPDHRDKLIVSLLVLREDGHLEHKDIARVLGIKPRWYRRVLHRVREQLSKFQQQ